MSKFSAVKLAPAFKDYLWGGEKLKSLYGKKSDMVPLAESWELSTHKDGQSIVVGGEYDGLTLTEYIEAIGGNAALGENCKKFDHFPILIKFIDAKQSLSVQVHPSNDYALEHEGEWGKTEMWYILDAEKDAFLYYGFNKDVTLAEYEAAIKNNTLTDILNAVKVTPGDVIFIPAGTVHAIGAGIVICEIQQNSNTTYRVYDYARRDKNGNTRPLHIEKALAVSNLKKSPELPQIPECDDVILSSCEFFTVRKSVVKGTKDISLNEKSFLSIVVVDGSAEMTHQEDKISLCKGESIFIPAQAGTVNVSGKCELIISYID